MSKQTTIPGCEPEDVTTPEDNDRVYAWLDAKADQKRAATKTRDAHLVLVTALQERGIERYPFVDQFTGKKRFVAVERAPKAKATNVPKPPKPKREKPAREKPDPAEQVEHRKVSRASVEKEIDPFASVRSSMNGDAAS